MADTGLTVVGAGVVGLAVAARLASRFPGLVVVERRQRHGSETSSRNSEVVHAGMYYPTDSLKARLCVEGNRRIYALAERFSIPCRRIGKVIVAVEPEEEAAIERIAAQGRANGVDLERLTDQAFSKLEPNVRRPIAALLSPNTGIVSAHGLMDVLLHQAASADAIIQRRAELVAVERRTGDYALTVQTANGRESFTSERVVNAAGLEAHNVASLAGIDVERAGYRVHFCKGSYFSVAQRLSSIVGRLVYPVPSSVSLGTHAVLGLDGRLRFGPDAEYLGEGHFDYAVDPGRRAAFGAAVRRLVPTIRDEDLEPDIAGVRPKLQGPGEAFRDFVLADEAARGLSGFINLVGIDSPGLTAALAIAERVAGLLGV